MALSKLCDSSARANQSFFETTDVTDPARLAAAPPLSAAPGFLAWD
ncbi:hypothetical protein IVB15_05710 [Bradyrhizobium sp. 182]|nr:MULTISPECIES: hypothetical protein [unclassified Bradyrhizobium]MCK1420807.1 hypothetical protein [Bradyrhizobium sp. CW12]MCK1527250.1 hypothetical protein [Bradyrhizobium sp. 182]MCK1617538.1 hypothetical protein [Bradyrhizobium sp. 159]MCK1648834.1 hypothetical protein [Bradyrhizobium sp. 154]MCK1759172.1 hypothetical protein [Bradyrhizobium sp. 137]